MSFFKVLIAFHILVHVYLCVFIILILKVLLPISLRVKWHMFMIWNFLKFQVRLHVCNFWLGFHMQDVSRMDFSNGCTYAPSQRASTILQCASWGWQHQICCRRLVYLLNLAFRDRGNRALAGFYKKEKNEIKIRC